MLSAVYQPDFCTTQLMVPTPVRRQEIPQMNPDKGGCFEKSKIYNIFRVILHFFVHHIIPYVFIQSLDAFSENLQCK